MKRKLLSSLMLSVLLTGAVAAHAEDGTITFGGSIKDGTCTINANNRDIVVNFGQVSTVQSTAPNAKSINKKFNITLSSCPASISNAIVSWAGLVATGGDSYSLSARTVANGKPVSGVYWNIAEGDQESSSTTLSNKVNFTGTPGNPQPIVEGDNNLVYTAAYVSTNTAVTGDVTGAASYTITYN
ncbi:MULTISPECIES: fimbrial protein [Enterobacterales]|uniref:fimbrial protein n=1 Tax=Enterobacterales TaxID=91347 RepID=UPI002EDA6FAB